MAIQIEDWVTYLPFLDPQRLCRTLMLEVLEQLRTAPARRFLRTLAEQKEDTAMAREAATGSNRLEQQT
jgi:hypothetical protein